MGAKPCYLSPYIARVIELFSDKYPAKIVSPFLLSCFVVDTSSGKARYYPITRLQIINAPHSLPKLEVHIDTYSYCQNPIGVKTLITGLDILSYIQRTSEIDEGYLYCPELGRKIKYISISSDKDEDWVKLLKEGILLFK